MATAYEVQDVPLGATKHVRIVGIGAGASGINMIRTLRRSLRDYEHVVYEKNDNIGGTWYENRYPGCRCDIPSHNYQFSWRPNHEWTSFFSPAAEIEAYLCKICEDEKMMDTIKTSHKVTSARWDEENGLWNLTVMNLQTGEDFNDFCHFLIDGSGILKYVLISGVRLFGNEHQGANMLMPVIGSGQTLPDSRSSRGSLSTRPIGPRISTGQTRQSPSSATAHLACKYCPLSSRVSPCRSDQMVTVTT